MKLLKQANVSNKRVMVRIDFNGLWRIMASLPTIDYLIKHKAKQIIVIGHRGRPGGKVAPGLSLTGFKPFFPKQIVLLENLRFDAREEGNDKSLAKDLAQKADIFVQEAFSVCHRKHASIVSLPKLLPSSAGLLLEKEVKELSRRFERPVIFIIGGAKVKTKLPIAKDLLRKNKLDHLILGGLVANKILFDNNKIDLTDTRLHLPVDAITETGGYSVGNVPDNDHILDIGPDSIALFKDIIKASNTLIWNGAVGKFEDKRYENGTDKIARYIANSNTYSIVGGGDMIEACQKFNVLDKISFVSTGGGAMLEFLSTGTLPGIEALQ